ETFFQVRDITDLSPIEETKIYLYRGDGSLYLERTAAYDAPTKRAEHVNNADFFPLSNLDEDFKVRMTVKDRAGNIWKSQLQTVRWDGITDAPLEPFG